MNLDDVRVATPCHASWADMSGDDRKRHCADCRLNVYNLSAMTRAEAADFLERSEGRVPALRSATQGREGVCVRLYRRLDGTVLTSDCPVGLATAARLRLGKLVACLLAMASALFWAVGAGQVEWRKSSVLQPIITWLEKAPEDPVMGIVAPPRDR